MVKASLIPNFKKTSSVLIFSLTPCRNSIMEKIDILKFVLCGAILRTEATKINYVKSENFYLLS